MLNSLVTITTRGTRTADTSCSRKPVKNLSDCNRHWLSFYDVWPFEDPHMNQDKNCTWALTLNIKSWKWRDPAVWNIWKSRVCSALRTQDTLRMIQNVVRNAGTLYLLFVSIPSRYVPSPSSVSPPLQILRLKRDHGATDKGLSVQNLVKLARSSH